MKRGIWFGLAIALTALWGINIAHKANAQVGPPNTILCNQFALQGASQTTIISLTTGISGKIIALCGWHVTNSVASSQNFTLVSGTGTNCTTTSTIAAGPFSVTSSAPSTDHIEFASLSLASGNNLCVLSSGTNLSIGVWLSQF